MVFSRLGAMLGMGSAHLELETPGVPVYRGSDVRGSVVLVGGRVSQRIRKVTADLYEYWITGHGKSRSYHQRCHGRVLLGEFIPLDPGQTERYEFVLKLPDDARCSRRREGWEVRAEAHIPWSVDSRASAPIRVVPHAEVLAVQRAARDWLKLQPLEWDGARAEVYYNFRAPNEMRHVLDGMALRIGVTDDVVEVIVDFNKQEHTMRDRLKALVGGDHERMALRIPRADLVSKRGTPRPAGAYAPLATILERLGLVAPPIPETGITQGDTQQ
jgi:sporulation-control protein spo0M